MERNIGSEVYSIAKYSAHAGGKPAYEEEQVEDLNHVKGQYISGSIEAQSHTWSSVAFPDAYHLKN